VDAVIFLSDLLPFPGLYPAGRYWQQGKSVCVAVFILFGWLITIFWLLIRLNNTVVFWLFIFIPLLLP